MDRQVGWQVREVEGGEGGRHCWEECLVCVGGGTAAWLLWCSDTVLESVLEARFWRLFRREMRWIMHHASCYCLK